MRPFSNETLNGFCRKYELCEYFCRNPFETFKWKSFEQWKTMYLWICCFAPVISQRHINYTLVHSSKLLVYLFHVRLIKTAMFSRFLKVDLPTSNFMNEVYDDGFSVSMWKKKSSRSFEITYMKLGNKKQN